MVITGGSITGGEALFVRGQFWFIKFLRGQLWVTYSISFALASIFSTKFLVLVKGFIGSTESCYCCTLFGGLPQQQQQQPMYGQFGPFMQQQSVYPHYGGSTQQPVYNQ
ncbi:uncharacterized protein LOC133793762 [Humulus lupulus]|uniref:uncharacterized protein LOC133793762 n=1 Tax=Humulus lupulus TaxID=3486 RepID=UPI002B404D25|nr:uncharacterized protein LOC133793762 [Humulus lupulus]